MLRYRSDLMCNNSESSATNRLMISFHVCMSNCFIFAICLRIMLSFWDTTSSKNSPQDPLYPSLCKTCSKIPNSCTAFCIELQYGDQIIQLILDIIVILFHFLKILHIVFFAELREHQHIKYGRCTVPSHVFGGAFVFSSHASHVQRVVDTTERCDRTHLFGSKQVGESKRFKEEVDLDAQALSTSLARPRRSNSVRCIPHTSPFSICPHRREGEAVEWCFGIHRFSIFRTFALSDGEGTC